MSNSYTPRALGLFLNEPALQYLRSLVDSNPWKAFVIIHASLKSQIEYMLYYLPEAHHIKMIVSSQTIIDTSEQRSLRWKIITSLRYRESVDSLLVGCLIDKTLRDRLVNFNNDRNKMVAHIGHGKVAKDATIRKSCLKGFELLKEINRIFAQKFLPSGQADVIE